MQRQACSQSATKTKRTEGANRKFYHKEILVNAYQARGNALLPKPTFRKLPLDLALGKPCAQQWQESFLSCREIGGECFPRYSFSITRFLFFFSLLLYTTHTWTMFSWEFAFSPSLSLGSPGSAVYSPQGAPEARSGRFQAPLLRAAAARHMQLRLLHLWIYQIWALLIASLVYRSWAGRFTVATPVRPPHGRAERVFYLRVVYLRGVVGEGPVSAQKKMVKAMLPKTLLGFTFGKWLLRHVYLDQQV